MKLEWHKCPCSSPQCQVQYPANIGHFYQGCGFTPEERAVMDEAFAALEEKKLAVRNRTTQNYMTTDQIELALGFKQKKED
jgi:hypothetical protein